MIETNIIKAASDTGRREAAVSRFVLHLSEARAAADAEEALLTGPLEPTNEWYAIAKIAGIKLCQAYRRQYGGDFISAMPTNLYGPGDNFDLKTSHVHAGPHPQGARGEASAATPTLTVWGTGTPRREFLHVDDAADAMVFLVKHYSDAEHVNVGAGEDLTILELAQKITRVVGFAGEIVTDPSKPDGTPRKLVKTDRLFGLGWAPMIPPRRGS